MTTLSKALLTHVTLVSFVTSMCLNVSQEIAGSHKCLHANVTYVRPFNNVIWHICNLTCITVYPRNHIIHLFWQWITQHIGLSLIITFTIYITDRCVGQNSSLILPLSTFTS